MGWTKDYSRSLIGGILMLIIAWFFTSIIVYIFLSAIVASAGRPVMRLLGKIRIRNKKLPNSIKAAIVLFVLVNGITLFAAVLAPAIVSEANTISNINLELVSTQLDNRLEPLEQLLHDRKLITDDHDFKDVIKYNTIQLVKSLDLNSLASNIIGLTGSIFMSVFAILFMSFFFLKDEKLFPTLVLLFVSSRNHARVSHIMEKVRKTLSRYFFGLLIEISTMMLLLTIGGFIIGIENPVLIGFIGGLLNVIPYLGPLIGAFIGGSLVLLNQVVFGIDSALLLSGQVLIVFAIANLVDNFVLQPLIYSNSVYMHPLAIFIFIFAGGIIGGPIGMVLAIPITTILRIIIGEFFGDDPLVKKLVKGV